MPTETGDGDQQEGRNKDAEYINTSTEDEDDGEDDEGDEGYEKKHGHAGKQDGRGAAPPISSAADATLPKKKKAVPRRGFRAQPSSKGKGRADLATPLRETEDDVMATKIGTAAMRPPPLPPTRASGSAKKPPPKKLKPAALKSMKVPQGEYPFASVGAPSPGISKKSGSTTRAPNRVRITDSERPGFPPHLTEDQCRKIAERSLPPSPMNLRKLATAINWPLVKADGKRNDRRGWVTDTYLRQNSPQYINKRGEFYANHKFKKFDPEAVGIPKIFWVPLQENVAGWKKGKWNNADDFKNDNQLKAHTPMMIQSQDPYTGTMMAKSIPGSSDPVELYKLDQCRASPYDIAEYAAGIMKDRPLVGKDWGKPRMGSDNVEKIEVTTAAVTQCADKQRDVGLALNGIRDKERKMAQKERRWKEDEAALLESVREQHEWLDIRDQKIAWQRTESERANAKAYHQAMRAADAKLQLELEKSEFERKVAHMTDRVDAVQLAYDWEENESGNDNEVNDGDSEITGLTSTAPTSLRSNI